MHIYLSCDVEGLNGICHSSQTQPQESSYEHMLKIFHDEVNSVIEGLKDARVDKITLADAHWDMRNLQIDRLTSGVSLISGSPRDLSMLSQVKELKPDAIICLGYHAKIGSLNGVLGHTYRAKVFSDVMVNDVSLGELGLNCLLASTLNIPVVLVSGDNVLKEEALSLFGRVNFHVSKIAINKYSAIFSPYNENLAMLRANTKTALENKSTWASLTGFKPPYTLKLRFFCPSMADGACLINNVKRLESNLIAFTDDDFEVVFKTMLAMGAIGASRVNNYF